MVKIYRVIRIKLYGGMYLPPSFFCHNTLFFSKDIVLCAMSTTQYSFLKIMCCGYKNNVFWQTCHNTLFIETQHIIFSKNTVLWQICHNTLLFEPQHIIIFSKNIVLRTRRTTKFFEKIMCCDSKSNVLWQTYHNTIFFEKIMCCGRKIRWQIHATIKLNQLV